MRRFFVPFVAAVLSTLTAAEPVLPPALEPWREWVLADQPAINSPARFDNAAQRLAGWPSALQLEVQADGGLFVLEVVMFDEGWITLPGGPDQWPQQVRANEQPVAVTRRDSAPAVKLMPGLHRLTGTYRWQALPEHLAIPQSIGVLTLTLNGQPVEAPHWDTQGLLWLQRNPAEAADQDQLGVKVYRLLSDGIPMWLATSVELTVTGKSREVELGHALPEGWQVAKVASPLPCLVDDAGLLKVQVRPGTWQVSLTAFRTRSLEEMAYAQGTRPLAASELVALQPDPTLRVVELAGLDPVDASQTTFPQEWRTWPVFAWTTAQPFRVEEKMRGMGMEKPAPPGITRELWLDEDGQALTFRDVIEGGAQHVWRLDVAEGQELGAVKVRGVSQLITKNPRTGRPGVEVRDRVLSLEAVGRAPVGTTVPAAGWDTVAGPVRCEWHLPPGWRLVALFGAEWVHGDWLTAWSLLDVFLLLVFSLAVQRLWGWRAGLVAFGAFVLAYHEPGAPRWTWLLLVIVLAAARALAGVRHALARRWPIAVGLAVIALLWALVPFVTRQVTGLLYPQLERPEATYGMSVASSVLREAAGVDVSGDPFGDSAGVRPAKPVVLNSNLAYDQSAQIQTGPAVPKWTWRSVSYGWNGPVAAGQTVRPILLSCGWQRVLIVVRLALLGALLYFLLQRPAAAGASALPPGLPKAPPPPPLPVTAVVVAVFVSGSALVAQAQDPGSPAVPFSANPVEPPAALVLPSAEWLAVLRERLLQPDDAFPHAAEIATASLRLADRRLDLSMEVHAAVETAVPVPGRLPAWSPLSVQVDGQAGPALQRLDGHVWVVVPAGVHRVEVTGVVPPGREWEWSFLLVPRHVDIEAPGWTVTGLRPNGVPENQIFFTEQQADGASVAAYDRRDFEPLVVIERHLELGLVWQVRTTARRLTDKGPAIAITVPLLPGERLLTSNLTTVDQRAEVRLGAQEEAVEWRSELTPSESLTLQSEVSDRWVERWYLEASPVWNVALEGIAPLYESTEGSLIPVWRPWPGESVTLRATQPEAIRGQTMTVREVAYATQLGGYQRSATLTLDVHASIGHEMSIELPADAEVTGLTSAGQRVPVRLKDRQVMVPVRPGEQSITLQWTAPRSLPLRAEVDGLRLPVESANVTTSVAMPAQRWVLWATGPLRGPAVRFWSLLVCALLFAWGLGVVPLPTLKRWEWALLLVGLTQTSLMAGFGFVLWVFALAARGRYGPQTRSWMVFNLAQLALAAGALLAVGVLISVLHVGLLGDPRMFIRGEGSTTTLLRWFEPRSGFDLPTPAVFSVSIWIYRLLMLAWALWLAFALLRWVKWGWQQFTAGALWRSGPGQPPPVPSTEVGATVPPLPPAQPASVTEA